MSKLRALGKYLKEQHTNGRQIYSALFLTAATIATGGLFGWAALGAATLQQGIALAVGGTIGVGLGAYAGAPMVKEFVTGAIDAVKNTDSGDGGGSNASPHSKADSKARNISGPAVAQKHASTWDRIKSLTGVFRQSAAPKAAASHSIATPKLNRSHGLG